MLLHHPWKVKVQTVPNFKDTALKNQTFLSYGRMDIDNMTIVDENAHVLRA